jgi:AraC-like DNA-binding protein
MDLVGFLYGFGVLQGLILAGVLLIAASGHRLANGFMAGLVLAIALNLLQSWLIRVGYYLEHPGGALLVPPLDFVWGPLLFLYAYTLTTGSASWRQLGHFLPAVLVFLGMNSAFWGISQDQQSNFVAYLWSVRTDERLGQQIGQDIPLLGKVWMDYHLQGSLFALQFGIYSALVLLQINRHNQRLQQHFSSLEDMNLRWLRRLTMACLLFLLIFLVFNRGKLITVGHFDVNALGPSTPSMFLVVLIYLIGISAIFQPDLVRGVLAARDSDPNRGPASVSDDVTEEPDPAIQAPPPGAVPPAAQDSPGQVKSAKYQRSAISMEAAGQYKVQLMEVMQEEELYLDCELTLPDLARATDLTPHQVSQVINGQMNQNFFSFVNTYRIQLAKKLMSDPETRNMPIVELAVEVGFKSKSSFYDAFKKATDMTPTQFKKSQQD